MKPIFDSIRLGGPFSIYVRCSFAGCVFALILSQATPAVAQDDLFSMTLQNSTDQSELNLVLAGDITPSDIASIVNPFGIGGTYGNLYDPTANVTTLSFFASPGSIPSSVTVGLDNTVASQFTQAYWGPVSSTPPAGNILPIVSPSITPAPPYGNNTQFILMYMMIEFANGSSVGEWDELQVPSNVPFQVGLGNDDNEAGPQFLFDARFMFSTTEIPLDDLNNMYEPPTGSAFQPLGIPDGSMLPPGSTLEAPPLVALPEPPSIILFSAPALGLLACSQLPKKLKKSLGE
jgi:hypothetical protein